MATATTAPAERPVSPALPRLRFDGVGLLVLACAALFLFSWWNRYLAPAATGYELVFAEEYARGHLPYRDYYFPVQPGWVLASAAVVQVCGPRLIVFWFLGVVARLLSFWCAYRLLARLCPRWLAGWLALVAFVASCGDIADYPAWYNYLTTAFAVFVAYAAVRCVEAQGRGRWPWAVLTGLAVALEFLTKQTSGVLVGLSALVALFLALTWRHGPRRAAVDLLTVVAAALIPCLATAGWLVANGAWSAYVDQVYLSGPSSKGGLGGALVRIVELIAWVPYWRTPVLGVGWVLAIMVVLRKTTSASGEAARKQLLLRAGLLVAAGLGLLLVGRRLGFSYADFRTLQLAACAVGLAGSFAVLLLALRAALRGERDVPTLVLGVVGAVSFASSFALSLSWPLFEPMIWPGLALAFVAFWRGTPGEEARRRLQALAVVVGVLVIGCSVWRKFEEPFGWGYWNEPPLSWTAREPQVPELAGFRLAPKAAAMYEDVARLIHENARPDEPILVFPHMPLIYGIGERPLATFSYMHWLDVCPDYVAAADAERIRQHPPAVIVAPSFPDWVWQGEEMAFRSGRPSGQRQLVAAMRELEEREYRLVGEFPIGELPGGSDSPDFQSKATLFLRVWARRR